MPVLRSRRILVLLNRVWFDRVPDVREFLINFDLAESLHVLQYHVVVSRWLLEQVFVGSRPTCGLPQMHLVLSL